MAWTRDQKLAISAIAVSILIYVVGKLFESIPKPPAQTTIINYPPYVPIVKEPGHMDENIDSMKNLLKNMVTIMSSRADSTRSAVDTTSVAISNPNEFSPIQVLREENKTSKNNDPYDDGDGYYYDAARDLAKQFKERKTITTPNN